MPMPRPPVGGMPYSSARRKSSSHRLRLVVAGLARARLLLEAVALVDRVVELAVGVGQLLPGDEQLEALGQLRVAALGLASGEISSG